MKRIWKLKNKMKLNRNVLHNILGTTIPVNQLKMKYEIETSFIFTDNNFDSLL